MPGHARRMRVDQRRAVVTGGAGFLGSHMCERLLGGGWKVLARRAMVWVTAAGVVVTHVAFVVVGHLRSL